MALDLAKDIQKNLGYTEIQKIDPNTGNVPGEHQAFGNNSVAQAAIPAVLCGLYNYSQDSQSAWDILQKTPDENWLEMIFGKDTDELIQKIADYASDSFESCRIEIQHILKEAVRLVQFHANETDHRTVNALLVNQRTVFLQYLPPALHLGILLKNATMDDNTHKMAGPISGFMHNLEKQFNTNDSSVKK